MARHKEHNLKRSSKRRNSGSEGERSEPEFLLVGKITRPHGIVGEVLMKIITDYPERLHGFDSLFVGRNHKVYEVTMIRVHSKGLLIDFKGISDRDAADALRQQNIYIRREDAVPLEDGEYYLYQIENILVVTDQGETLGHLDSIMETGANSVYVIRTAEDKEILLPAIPDVILNVDIKSQIMTVHLLDGLI